MSPPHKVLRAGVAERDKKRFFCLGEVSKSTRIPRNALANACATGRVPYTRSPAGYRLISEGVLERLRSHGLSAFPRPAATSSEATAEESQNGPSVPAERLGLLGEPSAELKALKEATEGTKMRLERERVDWELERLRQEREKERAAAAEAQHAERAEEEAAAEHEQQAEMARQREAKRMEWLKHEAELAGDRLRFAWIVQGLDQNHLNEDRENIEAALAPEIAKRLHDLSPDSSWSVRESARQAAVDCVMKPYLRDHNLQGTIRSAMYEIPRYLEELRNKGWITVDSKDLEFYARRMEPRVRAFLEAESRDRELTHLEAKDLVCRFIDEELKLA